MTPPLSGQPGDPKPHTKAAYKAALEAIANRRGGAIDQLTARNTLAGRHYQDHGHPKAPTQAPGCWDQ